MLAEVYFIEAGFWRYFFGIAFLIGLQLYTRERFSWNAVKATTIGLLLVGVVGLYGFNLFFFLGLKYTSAVNAALIISFNPLLTKLLAAYLLGTQITNRQKIGLLMSVVGVFYLLSKGELTELLALNWSYGDLLIIASTTLFTLYQVWVKMYSTKFPNLSFTTLTNVLCFVSFFLTIPFIGGFEAPPISDRSFWLAALGMGIPGTGLAYLFWNNGVNVLGAGAAGFYLNVVPLSAAIMGIFFGVQLEIYHFFSGLLIIGSLLYVQIGEQPKG